MRHWLLLYILSVLLQPAIAGTLADDHRIGVVADTQGVVTLRPGFGDRWSPAGAGVVLKPGDWLKTAVRGAHAARTVLTDGTELVLGPGGLLEFGSDGGIKLMAGELSVVPPKDGKTTIAGPGEARETFARPMVVRANEGLQKLKGKPKWLRGFEGAMVQESMGSLLAKVDGREVPLSIGYHRVKVDIRDQIARTVIEESFVNHTDSRLEGVFYFPLPEDASISNFGMWIGGELVEADVVEKQRAREIFEIILREKRDPGLLEWSGGNLFKARVFPIFAHSEKRVTITYTQVLPRHGNRTTYEYALRSELLRQRPLKELAIDVKVSSALPLAGVDCPSHEVRQDVGKHAASLSYEAREVRPDKDFVVHIDVPGDAPEVAVVPSLRGRDGYFMMLLSPKVVAADDDRVVVPAGDPVRVTVVADTSGSMDEPARQRQAAFVAALLSALGPQDRFRVLACDAACRTAPGDFQEPTPQALDQVLAFLEGQESLGWTDLDAMTAAALEGAQRGDLVIYVGDGIPSAGEADPAATSARLSKAFGDAGVVGHAVAVSNQFEAQTLRAVAGTSGTWRRVKEPTEALAAAASLLEEALGASVVGTECRFEGVRVAQAYPNPLPAIGPGRQLVLLGRYLPGKPGDKLSVTCTGQRNGQPVTFSGSATLPEKDGGNAFVPRLWARRYLDALLEQGRSEEIKAEVVELSEIYRIMTPYTSFLVLESDADRERFGVKRRFRMRDGERFFAEGRKAADYELQRRHMLQAADWRIELRRGLVEQIAAIATGNMLLWGGMVPRDYGLNAPVTTSAVTRFSADYKTDLLRSAEAEHVVDESESAQREQGVDFDRFADQESLNQSVKMEEKELRELEATEMPAPPPMEMAKVAAGKRSSGMERSKAMEPSVLDGLIAGNYRNEMDGRYYSMAGEIAADMPFQSAPMGYLEDLGGWGGMGGGGAAWGRGPASGAHDQGWYEPWWFTQVFPGLSVAVEDVEPAQPRVRWPETVEGLSSALYKRDAVAAAGPIKLVEETTYYNVERQEVSNRSSGAYLLAAKRWVAHHEQPAEMATTSWCDAAQCGIYTDAFSAGRVRKSNERDTRYWPTGPGNFTFSRLVDSYGPGTWDVALVEKQATREVTFTSKSTPGYKLVLTVDLRRNVVTGFDSYSEDKLYSQQKYDRFVSLGEGIWVPGRTVTLDAQGRETMVRELQWETLDSGGAEKWSKSLLAGRENALLLASPLPDLLEAKQVTQGDSPTVESALRMALHFGNTQQWPRTRTWLELARKLTKDHPALTWLDEELMVQERTHEELKRRYLARALKLQQDESQRALFLARRMLDNGPGFLYGEEQLKLLELLEPTLKRAPDYLGLQRRLGMSRFNALQSVSRVQEAMELLEELAKAFPRSYDVQYNYISQLGQRGEVEKAIPWLTALLANQGPWADYEKASLKGLVAQSLFDAGLHERLSAYCRTWADSNPKDIQPYQWVLSLLVMNGEQEAADALARKWLALADSISDWGSADAFRFQAGYYHALGQGRMYYSGYVSPEWFKVLAEVALDLAHEQQINHLFWQLFNHYGFLASDEGKTFYVELANRLLSKLVEMPAGNLYTVTQWLLSAPPEQREKIDWQRLIDVVKARWNKGVEADEQMVAMTLDQFFTGLGRDDDALAFARERLEKAPSNRRAEMAGLYFYKLVYGSWTPEREKEALSTLDKLGSSEAKDVAHLTRVGALATLASWAENGRYRAAVDAIKKPNELTRSELASAYREARAGARRETARMLLEESERHGHALARWFMVERTVFLARLGDDVKELLRTAFGGLTPPASRMPGGENERLAMESRWFDILDYLVMRHAPEGEDANNLLSIYRQRVGSDGPGVHTWRLRLFRLLVVLERADELEKVVREWAAQDRADSLWRITLGQLLAEQGRFDEAVALFEKVADEDELTRQEWQVLADWYMALDRKEDRERALTGQLLVLDEYALNNWLQTRMYELQGQQQGAAIEDRDVAVARALLRKAAYPGSYIWLVGELYRITRDFRLFAALPESLSGHTAAEVYPALQNLVYQLQDVLDEAAVDEMVKACQQARKKAETDLDRRALDLLEALIEGRAAMIQDQPGPHIERARNALERANKGRWEAGERMLMAQLLESMGQLESKDLAQLQLQQFWSLLEGAVEASAERLNVAVSYARTLQLYDRLPEAVDLLERELGWHHKHHGTYNADSSSVVSTLVSLYEQTGRYKSAEELLRNALAEERMPSQVNWLRSQLFSLFEHALSNNGTLSHGTGAALYRGAYKEIWASVEKANAMQIRDLLRPLIYLVQAAHRLGVKEAAADGRALLTWSLDKVFLHPQNAHSLVSEVASMAHNVLGAQAAFTYLLDAIDREPVWLDRTGQDGMTWHSYSLGDWRAQFPLTGKLEQRYLALLLKTLRRDLETLNGGRSCATSYHHCSGRFWNAHKADFLRLALDVVKEHPKDAAMLEFVADYLAEGIRDSGEAIKLLQRGLKQKLLTEGGQRRLINLLIDANRHKEALDPLRALLKLYPTDVWLHGQHIEVRGRTQGRTEAEKALKLARRLLEKGKLWNAGNAGTLAQFAMQGTLYDAADKLYSEAIVLWRQAVPDSGHGDATLAEYYRNQALARSELGRSVPAVEAAASAVVAWGSDRDSRTAALSTLKLVIEQAKELKDIVRHVEQEAADTGLENPLLRRTLADVLIGRKRCSEALEHLAVLEGIDFDPVALYGMRAKAYDCLDEPAQANAALAQQILASPYELERYRELASRLTRAGNESRARRVLTGMVEILPGEAESHRFLAQAFEAHGNLAEAIVQWDHVVRLRGEDPAGYLDLARALAKDGRLLRAGKVVAEILSKDWHADFLYIVDDARTFLKELEAMNRE